MDTDIETQADANCGVAMQRADLVAALPTSTFVTRAVDGATAAATMEAILDCSEKNQVQKVRKRSKEVAEGRQVEAFCNIRGKMVSQ